ncbi:ATP-binding cassette domain-containing protein [Enterococcus durans]|uniref:ATP-binding cassette domain-containing protein n=1 Tax=Enterococcus durans TaxID=53345 RepID=A0A5N0YQN6_9ENTE|nr:ATP-binding cassette domain-containing protein [Enterococcus durans]KAA9178089.1 ATP-binding cassette domain-containing protein [Enterococcus durans]KAA9184271.1 ATP-binding cassette domain-containing protein [Enterococcus durans]KAA9185348.1 ATP-binding cassette domain-containing protein [Enterococcus durans]KAA9189604.1 ATP-binding cassette domain-containing protein [Enterococcus durans]KAA9192134.1 ATP-binding cassette domain-containing protein [Enterococcus durans]
MIEVRGISKKFNEKVVFEELSFTLDSGSMIAIIGESGSGKTTLLNCLGQLEEVDKGEIFINGEKILRKHKRKFFQEQAGFLFQNFALIDNETVKKNLQLVTKDQSKIVAALEKFQVEQLLNQKIFRLSGGEQQRVALAHLFLKNPPLIFADEPTASLDQKNKEIVIQTLQELNRQGKTVIVVTHDLELAKRLGRVIDLTELKKSDYLLA